MISILKESTIRKIPNLSSIEQIYYNNTKLVREVFKNIVPLDGKYQNITLFDDVQIRVRLRNQNREGFQFEPIDSLVFDAICSLYSNNVQVFTVDMVARIMYHDAHHRVSKNILNSIEYRIETMCKLQICLDISEEIAARQELPKTSCLQKSRYCQFLQLETIVAKHVDNAKICFAYRFCRAPLLWEYARYTRQIVSCRYGAFHLEDHSTTIESLLILRYVHLRISEMRNTKNHLHSRKISFEWTDSEKKDRGLFEACNIQRDEYRNWNDKHRKICKLIEAYLYQLQQSSDSAERIKSFKAYTKIGSRMVAGYEIQLPYLFLKKNK